MSDSVETRPRIAPLGALLLAALFATLAFAGSRMTIDVLTVDDITAVAGAQMDLTGATGQSTRLTANGGYWIVQSDGSLVAQGAPGAAGVAGKSVQILGGTGNAFGSVAATITVNGGDSGSTAGTVAVVGNTSVTGLLTGTNYARGSGSPEGVVAAAIGALYLNTANGDLYRKTSGAGNTGWTLGGGGGGASTLAATLAAGNVTGGTSIVMSSGDLIRGVDASGASATGVSLRGGNNDGPANGATLTLAPGVSNTRGGDVTLSSGGGTNVWSGNLTITLGAPGGADSNATLAINTPNCTGAFSRAASPIVVTGGNGVNGGAGGAVTITAGNAAPVTLNATTLAQHAGTSNNTVHCLDGIQQDETEGSAQNVCTIGIAQGTACSGQLRVRILCTDGTDFQSIEQIVTFSAVNKAGTVTADIDFPAAGVGNSEAVSAGTLTCTWALAEGAADTLQFTATATSSLVTTTATFSGSIEWHGTGTFTAN